MSLTTLAIEESLSYCLAGLRYSPLAYLTFISLYLSFDGLKSPLLKDCFSDLNLYEAVNSSSFVVQLKLKCLLMKPTPYDIFEAKEVCSQIFLKAIKGS